MYFSDTLPDRLREHPYPTQFAELLDALQNYKQEVISESLRVNNAAVLMDNKWLLKKLDEYGLSNLPVDYPVQIVQQLLLNINNVFFTRGSKIGIEFYCSLLSLGEVVVDDSNFYTQSKAIFLDSPLQGFVTDDSSKSIFYLVEDNSYINPEVSLGISIKSKYFNGDYPEEELLIKTYIESTISRQVGFSPNKTITFAYGSRDDFYFHKLLNPYFV